MATEENVPLVDRLLGMDAISANVTEMVTQFILITNDLHLSMAGKSAKLALALAAAILGWHILKNASQLKIEGVLSFFLLVAVVQVLLYPRSYSTSDFIGADSEFTDLQAATGPMLGWQGANKAYHLFKPPQTEDKFNVFEVIGSTYLTALKGTDTLIAYRDYIHMCGVIPDQLNKVNEGWVGWKYLGLKNGARLGFRSHQFMYIGQNFKQQKDVAVKMLFDHGASIGNGAFGGQSYRIPTEYDFGVRINNALDGKRFSDEELSESLKGEVYNAITYENTEYHIGKGDLQHPRQQLDTETTPIDDTFYAETCHELFYIVDLGIHNFYQATMVLLGPSILFNTSREYYTKNTITLHSATRNLNMYISKAIDDGGSSQLYGSNIYARGRDSIGNIFQADFSATVTSITTTIKEWMLRYGLMSFISLVTFAFGALYVLGPFVILCSIVFGWGVLRLYFQLYAVLAIVWFFNKVLLLISIDIIQTLSVYLNDSSNGITQGAFASTALLTGAVGTLFVVFCVMEFGIAYMIIKQDAVGFKGPSGDPFSAAPVSAAVGIATTVASLGVAKGVSAGMSGVKGVVKGTAVGANTKAPSPQIPRPPTNTYRGNSSPTPSSPTGITRGGSSVPSGPKMPDIGAKYMADINKRQKKPE